MDCYRIAGPIWIWYHIFKKKPWMDPKTRIYVDLTNLMNLCFPCVSDSSKHGDGSIDWYPCPLTISIQRPYSVTEMTMLQPCLNLREKRLRWNIDSLKEKRVLIRCPKAPFWKTVPFFGKKGTFWAAKRSTATWQKGTVFQNCAPGAPFSSRRFSSIALQ